MSGSTKQTAGSGQPGAGAEPAVREDAARLTVDDVSSYLGDLDFSSGTPAEQTAAYQEAAAVLAAIQNPAGLRTASGANGDAEELLLPDLVETPVPDLVGGGQMLRLDVRREALARLGTQQAMLAVLETNPQERGCAPLQQHFEQCLRGETKELAEQTIPELEATLQVAV